MAATDLVFSGLWYAVGAKMSAFIAGLDCGDYTVDATGSITVPLGSDPDGLLGYTYLASVDAIGDAGANWGDLNCQIAMSNGFGETTLNVPVVIGYAFTSQGQLLRPTVENDLKSPTGPGLGKTRRGHMFSALLQQSGPLQFGTNFTTMLASQFRYPQQTAYPSNVSFSGVHWNVLSDDYSFDGQVCWQQDRPYPLAVVSMGVFLKTQDR